MIIKLLRGGAARKSGPLLRLRGTGLADACENQAVFSVVSRRDEERSSARDRAYVVAASREGELSGPCAAGRGAEHGTIGK